MTVRTTLGDARRAAQAVEHDRHMTSVENVDTTRVGEFNTAREVFEGQAARLEEAIRANATRKLDALQELAKAEELMDHCVLKLITYLKAQNKALRQEVEAKDAKLASLMSTIKAQERRMARAAQEQHQGELNVEPVRGAVSAADVVKVFQESLESSLSGFLGFNASKIDVPKSFEEELEADAGNHYDKPVRYLVGDTVYSPAGHSYIITEAHQNARNFRIKRDGSYSPSSWVSRLILDEWARERRDSMRDRLMKSEPGQGLADDIKRSQFLPGSRVRVTLPYDGGTIDGEVTAVAGPYRTVRSFQTGLHFTREVDHLQHLDEVAPAKPKTSYEVGDKVWILTEEPRIAAEVVRVEHDRLHSYEVQIAAGQGPRFGSKVWRSWGELEPRE